MNEQLQSLGMIHAPASPMGPVGPGAPVRVACSRRNRAPSSYTSAAVGRSEPILIACADQAPRLACSRRVTKFGPPSRPSEGQTWLRAVVHALASVSGPRRRAQRAPSPR
jgi:hypothetical protein